MTHSHFANARGKADPSQYVTARDMALLAAHIIRDDQDYYHYFGEKEFTWNKIRQLNRNPLLTMDIGADGLKAADLGDGGFGLVGSAVQDGQRLIVVMYGLKSAAERVEEARKLFDYGFHSFDRRTVFEAGQTVGTASVYGGATGEVPLVSERPITLFAPRGESDKLVAKIVYTGPAGGAGREGAGCGAARDLARRHAGDRRSAEDRRSRRARGPDEPRASTPGSSLPATRCGTRCAGRWRTNDAARREAGSSRSKAGRGRASRCRRSAWRRGSRRWGSTSCARANPAARRTPRQLREAILSGFAAQFGPDGEALLFAAARIDHLDKTIVPALERGAWVVCDRFADSDPRLPGRRRQAAPGFIARLEEVVVGEPSRPHAHPRPPGRSRPRAGAAARRGAGSADRFEGEGLEFHETLRRAFLEIARGRARALRRRRRAEAGGGGRRGDLGRGRGAARSRARSRARAS